MIVTVCVCVCVCVGQRRRRCDGVRTQEIGRMESVCAEFEKMRGMVQPDSTQPQMVHARRFVMERAPMMELTA